MELAPTGFARSKQTIGSIVDREGYKNCAIIWSLAFGGQLDWLWSLQGSYCGPRVASGYLVIS